MIGSENRLMVISNQSLNNMSALDQYIDLYRSNSRLVDSNSAHIINRFRPSALRILEDNSLPPKGSENYETTDLESILSPDFGINLSRIDIDVNDRAPFQCGVPNMTSNLFFLRNDIYSETGNSKKDLPEGVTIESLRKFCDENPETAEKYYGRIADMNNPLVALNSLLVQDGIVIRIREGVRLEKPVQVVGILENGMPIMAIRRILIIAEKDSAVKILLCDHTQRDGICFLNLQTIEVFAGENSSVEVIEMEESSEETSRLSSMFVKQAEGSNVSAVGITLYNGRTRNEYFCDFDGENAELKLSGIAIEDCCRQIDTYSVVKHSKPGCHTDELFKYVVDDEAMGAFSGLIKVNKGASKTEAYQSNRNIIGNDGARVYSKPTLEIYDDDVKCSHGSAIGQLDEKQIFYMRTRGLSENEARFLLKQAFMADVINRISLQDFKGRLHTLVEKRFAGESRGCTSCRKGCLDNA